MGERSPKFMAAQAAKQAAQTAQARQAEREVERQFDPQGIFRGEVVKPPSEPIFGASLRDIPDDLRQLTHAELERRFAAREALSPEDRNKLIELRVIREVGPWNDDRDILRMTRAKVIEQIIATESGHFPQ